MPPYQEESMCTKPKPLGTMAPTSPRSRQSPNGTMDDQGQNVQNGDEGRTNDNGSLHGGENNSPSINLNQRRSSPVKMRHRGQNSSTSSRSKTKNGRHITNINRINVINNFGSDGGNYFSTPWKKNQHHPNKAHLGWLILRIVLAILIIFWFGTMVSVMRSVPSPSASEAQSLAALNLPRWKKISEHIKGGVRGNNNAAVKPGDAKVKDDTDKDDADDDDAESS